MKRFTSLLTALVLLTSACATPAETVRDGHDAWGRAYVQLIVTTNNPDASYLRVACDGTQLKRVSNLSLARPVKEIVYLQGACRNLRIYVHRIGYRRDWRTPVLIPVRAGDTVKFTITWAIDQTNWFVR